MFKDSVSRTEVRLRKIDALKSGENSKVYCLWKNAMNTFVILIYIQLSVNQAILHKKCF